MLFGTAGVAIANFKSETDVQFANDAFFLSGFRFAGSASKTQAGLAVGGGVEYALARHVSLKAEYLYLNFPSLDYLSPFAPLADSAWRTRVDPDEHIVRVGVNFKM
jgi:outer membrane immunogenic protein